MLRNKRILMICKESNSYSFFFLAKLLIQSNKVKFFFILPQETMLNECKYNRFTYYNFKKEFPKEDVIDFNEEFLILFNKSLQEHFDYSYLEYIEKEYCQIKNLNELLIASQEYSRHLHDRFYTNFSIKENYYRLLELSFKKVISTIADYNPDLIIDSNDETMFRGIINEVAHKSIIPYIVYDSSRYNDFIIPSFSIGLKPLLKFKETYDINLRLEPSELKYEYLEIDKIRSSSILMSDIYLKTSTSKYVDDKFLIKIRKILAFLLYLLDIRFKGLSDPIKIPRFLNANHFKMFFYFVKSEIKFTFLSKKNKYFVNPCLGDKYIYFPLHVKPESSTFVRAVYHIDDLHIINQIAKALPMGVVLYVKEHQSMVGERSLSFYREVNKIPNVKLVKFNYYDDPKPWIANSIGVITVTGTSAYEAAILGKKSILFGNTSFNILEGVIQIDSYNKLKDAILLLGEIENKHSLAAYIRTVKNLGVRIDEHKITYESLRVLQGKRKEDYEFTEMINNMLIFYTKSYKIFEDELSLIQGQALKN